MFATWFSFVPIEDDYVQDADDNGPFYFRLYYISKRVDGKFLGPGGSSVPTGQAQVLHLPFVSLLDIEICIHSYVLLPFDLNNRILSGLLEECFEIAQDLRALHEDEVPTPLKPVCPPLSLFS